MLSDEIGEQHAQSVHATKEAAIESAQQFAKWTGWKWGVNCSIAALAIVLSIQPALAETVWLTEPAFHRAPTLDAQPPEPGDPWKRFEQEAPAGWVHPSTLSLPLEVSSNSPGPNTPGHTQVEIRGEVRTIPRWMAIEMLKREVAR